MPEEYRDFTMEPPPFPDDEPPKTYHYEKREVLASFEDRTGKHPTVIEIIRYTWSEAIRDRVGYPTCIRMRRKYIYPNGEFFGSESTGTAEEAWPAFVKFLQGVKI